MPSSRSANMPPEILYRYQTVSASLKAERDMFSKHQMWFADPRSLNDPFECRPHFIFSRGSELSEQEAAIVVANNAPPEMSFVDREKKVRELVTASKDEATRAAYQSTFADAMQTLLHSVSIKSFSTVPDSLPQWAYYANGHQGYCVGFRFSEPWSYADNAGRRLAVAIGQVEYAEDYPTFDCDIDFRDPDEESWFKGGLLTKSIHWKPENEWRAIRTNCRASYQRFEPAWIRSVILGAKMSPKRRAKVMKLLNRHPTPIEVYNARERPGRFELQLIPIGVAGAGNTLN